VVYIILFNSKYVNIVKKKIDRYCSPPHIKPLLSKKKKRGKKWLYKRGVLP
jgi:hypothetical protein